MFVKDAKMQAAKECENANLRVCQITINKYYIITLYDYTII